MDAMQQAFNEMIPQITEQVAAQLRDRALARFEHQVAEAVAKEVERYISENIVPAVAKELQAKDAEIRAALVSGVCAAVDVLGRQIQESVTKRVAGYDGDKLVADVMRILTPSRY